MRKILTLLLLLLIPHIGFTQTRPDWLDVKNKPELPKDVRSFGVKGDGITDDWNALKAACESGGFILIPPGLDILIDAPDGFVEQIQVSRDTHILNLGSTIRQKNTGGSYALRMLGFEAQSDGLSIVLENLRIDGSNAAHVGIRISNRNFIGGNVRVLGCSLANLTGASRPYSSSGISVYGLFDVVTIKENTITNVSRTTDVGSIGNASATGVTVTQATGVTTISGNKISNILSNANVSWVDADAIVVFAASATVATDKPHSALVENNIVENFSGRAVKLQTPGATVQANSFRCLSGITTQNSNFIDLQAGRGTITNNTLFLASGTTAGSSMAFISGAGQYENHRLFKITENTFISEVAIPYGLTITTDGLATTEIDFSRNAFRVASALQVTRISRSETTPDSFRTIYVVEKNRFNFVETPQRIDLMYVGGAYFTNSTRAATYNIRLIDNVCSVESSTFNPGYIMFGTFSDAIYAGWVQIRGNSGWAAGVRYTPEFAKILPDSSFYFNGNASYTFSSEIPVVGGRNNLQMIKDTYGHVRIASSTTSTYTEFVGYAPPTFPLASYTWQQVSP